MDRRLSLITRLREGSPEEAEVIEEHLTATQLDRFRRRALAPTELLAADIHLAGCLICREAASREAAGTASAESLLSSLCDVKSSPPVHLSYEQLVGLVDGSLNDVVRETMESHIAVCGECKADWRDLDGFRKSLATHPHRRPAGVTVVAWCRSALGLRGRQVRWTPLRAAAAIAGVALLIWMGSIPFRRDVTARRQETAQSAAQTPAQVAEDKNSLGTGMKPANKEIASLNDGGGPVALLADGSLAGLPGASADLRDAARDVLSGRRLAHPDDESGFAARPGMLLGGGQQAAPFETISPMGTAIITDQPTFRWRPMPGALRYEVLVYDDNYAQVAVSPPVKSTEWTASKSLRGGQVYSWQVKAFKDDEEVLSPKPPAPEAKFKVLDRKQAVELAQAQRDHSRSHLLLGILLARAGALDDAEREFAALAQANPQSPIPKRLLRELEELRR